MKVQRFEQSKYSLQSLALQAIERKSFLPSV